MSYIRGDKRQWFRNYAGDREPTGRIYGDGERLVGYGVSYMSYDLHAEVTMRVFERHIDPDGPVPLGDGTVDGDALLRFLATVFTQEWDLDPVEEL